MHYLPSRPGFADSIGVALLSIASYSPWLSRIEGVFPFVKRDDRCTWRIAEACTAM